MFKVGAVLSGFLYNQPAQGKNDNSVNGIYIVIMETAEPALATNWVDNRRTMIASNMQIAGHQKEFAPFLRCYRQRMRQSEENGRIFFINGVFSDVLL